MDININKILNVIKLSAQIILENGGETYRVEETIKFICKSCNIKEADAIATPTGFYLTISANGEEYSTIVKRIKNRTINLQKINDANSISRQLSSGAISLDDALTNLKNIADGPPCQYSHPFIYGGISSALFAALFGGGLFEFSAALFAGLAAAVISKYFEGLHSYKFFSSLISGALIAFIAVAAKSVSGIGNYNQIIVGSIMPLLPGLAMTNAIRDTIRGDLISGIARAAEALLIASSLAAGVGSIIYVAYSFGFWGI